MEKQFNKSAGIALLTGSILMVFALVLHPTGGSIEHMQKVKFMAMAVHTTAILILPVLGFGCLRLAILLSTPTKVSYLGFAFIVLGLMAGLIAATINGLTLPLFISHLPEKYDLTTIKLILKYGRYINMPMDYLMVGTFAVAIGIWSFLIVSTQKLSKYLGYFGFGICALGFISHFFNLDFSSLWGFRTFVFGIALWFIFVSISMIKLQDN